MATAELDIAGEIPTDPAERDAEIDAALERLRDLQAEIAGNDDVARRRIEMVTTWRDAENGRLQLEAQFWSQRLAALAEGYDYGAKKSRNLPHGTFGTRTLPGRVEILDMARAVEFARLLNLPVKVKEEVAKADLAKLAKSEFTPAEEDGWTWVAPREEFYVKTLPQEAADRG